MNIEVKNTNYRNDSILLGFSDLKRLKTERPLVFEKGKGIFIYDENGKDYIESVSCFYCVSLGFSEERLADAAYRQMKTLPMYSSAIHRTVPAVMELTERLATLSPVKNPRIYFSTTGSEANDHLHEVHVVRQRLCGRARAPQDDFAQGQLSRLDHRHLRAGRLAGPARQFRNPDGVLAAGQPSELAQCSTARRRRGGLHRQARGGTRTDHSRSRSRDHRRDDRGARLGLVRHVPAARQLFPEDHQGPEEIRHPALHRRGRDGLWPLRPHVGDGGHGPRARLHDLRQGHLRRLHADRRHHHGRGIQPPPRYRQ